MQKGELNKVWLVAGIALVVILVFLLAFFVRKGVTAGKAVTVTESLYAELIAGQFGIDPVAVNAAPGDLVEFTVRGGAEAYNIDTVQVELLYDGALLEFAGETGTANNDGSLPITSGITDHLSGFERLSALLYPDTNSIILSYSGGMGSFSQTQDIATLSFLVKDSAPTGATPQVNFGAGTLMMVGATPIDSGEFNVDAIIAVVAATPVDGEPAPVDGTLPPATTATIEEDSSGNLNLLLPGLAPGTFPIINWRVDADGANGGPAESITLLNMPFEAFSEDLNADASADTQATHVKDYSGNDIHGTVNGATFVTGGRYDGRGAYSFDGTDDYIITAVDSIINSERITEMTFEAWVHADSYAEKQVIMSKRHPNNNDGTFNIYVLANDVYFSFYSDQSTVTATHSSNSGVLTDGGWHHIMWVKKWGQAGTKLYVDGQEKGITTSGDLTQGTTYNQPIYIGVQAGSSQPNVANVLLHYFRGTIDNVRIYNRALSAEQVAAMYAEGTDDDTDNVYDAIVSQESLPGESWSAAVTLNDGTADTPTIITPAQIVSCRNGATNPPTCDLCPAGQHLSDGMCAVMSVTTTGFTDGAFQDPYTCADNNPDSGNHGINPPLTISGIPDAAQSLAIIMEDTTVPTVHWAVWNVPVSDGILAISQGWTVPAGATQGNNYLTQPGYAGPCPPMGDPTHTYVFHVYALNITPNFQAGTQLTSSALEIAVASNILAEAELSGTYNVLCAADNQCDDDETCNLITGLCSAAADLCASVVCEDNQQCRGGLCVPIASCEDEILNGNEEGVDCGDPSCPACTQTLSALDQPCVTGATCASGVCTNGACSCAEGAGYEQIASLCRPKAQVDGLQASIRNILTNNQQYPTLLHKISAIAREFKELTR